MFEIKYNFLKDNDMNVVNADETALRYNFILGSIALKKDNNSITLDWDWIPLLDFAICLLAICNSLVKKGQGMEKFEFTESDSIITFQKNGDKIRVVTSFSDQFLEMSFEEFQKVIRKFYKDVIFEAAEKNQAIKKNDSFIKYLKEAEKM
jgi:hypothetical protein